MALEAKTNVSPQEYLANERLAEYKSEYFNGEVFALAGASRNHNLIVANVMTGLHTRLSGESCEVYPSDMRVMIPTTGLYTYPDVVVVCGEPRFEDYHEDTLLNPTILFEVLSESTEAYDRGRKFANYRKVESLTAYVLIAQDAYRVEHYAQQPGNRWLLSVSDRLEDAVDLASIGCTLPLAEIYHKVKISGLNA